jgi:plasmid stability protein
MEALQETMPVTLTIKQVPDHLAQKLRVRATASHRSLQGELMVILIEALDAAPHASEPEAPVYKARRQGSKAAEHGRRLTLRELWERSRKLGSKSSSESTAIVRKLRDERHRH